MLSQIFIVIEPKIKILDRYLHFSSSSPCAFETQALMYLSKHRQPLLELAILGRHRGHSLWLLTQSYTAISNNIRRQAKMLYVWYPKNRTDLNTIHEENDIIGLEELARVKAQLK